MKRVITTILMTVLMVSIFATNKMDVSAYTRKCSESGCSNNAEGSSRYCYWHKCRINNCTSKRSSGSEYCSNHKCKSSGCSSSAYYTSGKWKGYCNNCAWKEAEKQGVVKKNASSSSKKSSSRSSKKMKADPYNVYAYKSAREFADDKYEEFYDYEDEFDDEDDAWDEAYDYWVRKHR